MKDKHKPLTSAKSLTLNPLSGKQLQRISSKLFKSAVVRASLILACWGAMSGRALALIEGYGYSTTAIYKIDFVTGAVTTVYTFPTALTGGAAIAQRPSDGMIFFMAGNVGNDPVYRWNPNTPTVAPVLLGTTGTPQNTAAPGQTTNPGYFPRLTFSPSGTLYAVNATSTILYSINQNTGAATQVGATLTGAAAGGGDIAFAPDGTLYMMLATNLYKVPLTGGAVTPLGTISGIASGTTITGLAVDINGKLVGSNSATPGVLYEIPYTGGAATLRATSSPGVAINDLASLVSPEFLITKTHTGNFTQGQTGATYTVTVKNDGNLSSTGATTTVTDTVPTGLTPTAASGTGWTCSISGQTVTCTRTDALAAGVSFPPITLTVDVASNAPTTITNTATLTHPQDPLIFDNTASDTTTINLAPDLTIAKTHTGNFTQAQTGATYTLTATNSGTAPTSGTVTVTDTVPTGLTPTAATGSGWTCTISGQTVTCTRSDALAAGSSYPAIALKVDVAANAPTSVTNTASVSGGGELVTSNDSASDPTTINPAADLSLTKTHTGNFQVGQNGTYTLTVNNNGSSAAAGPITVTDTLPSGLSFVSGTGTGWTCSASGQTVTCTNSSSLASGANSTITLTVAVGAGVASSVTNTATVSSTTSDPNNANNTANDATTITPTADLSITNTDGQTSTTAGSPITYTITITNNGPSTLNSVNVTDSVPSSIQNPTFTSSTGTYNSSTGAWTGLNLASGQSVTLTLKGTVSATATGTISNTATVAPPTGVTDPVNANNSATDTTNVTSVPSRLRLVKRITAINSVNITGFVDDPSDLNDDNNVNWPTPRTDSLRGAIDGGLVKPGDVVEYTIYFLSDGGNAATNVKVCDLLPANTTFIPATYNGLTPTDGGLSGVDSGITLAVGSTTPTAYLTNVADAPDRGQFFSPGTSAPAACNKASFTSPVPASSNVSGAVVVDVVKSPTSLPTATAPGTPANSYGFIRFQVRVN